MSENSTFPPRPFDLHDLHTYDLASRPSKVFREELGRPLPAGACVEEWLEHSLSFRPAHAKNLAGVIGGLLSALLIGVAAGFLSVRVRRSR